MTPVEANSVRIESLRRILVRERNKTVERVREYRHDQDDEATPAPADELDAARSLADVETHASLIEQAQERLRQIDDALARLERGRFGVCEDCGNQIAVERLEALPFATRCVDCQRGQQGTRRGKGGMIEPFGSKWQLPPEVDESSDEPRDHLMRTPEEELTVHNERPFGLEEGDLEKPPAKTPRRPRR